MEGVSGKHHLLSHHIAASLPLPLVLDDLGSERPTPWALEQSSHIIDYRLTEGLPMMITSNARTWNGLVKMLTYELPGDPVRRSHLALPVSRIVDRLRESVGDPFVMKGKSWRARSSSEHPDPGG